MSRGYGGLTATAAGLALSAGAAWSATPAASADAGFKTVEVGRLFPYYERYLKLPAADRTLFTVGYFIRENGRPASGRKAWLVKGAEREAVPIGSDGRLLRSPSLAEIAAKQPIAFDSPKGTKFGVRLQPLATLPSSTEMDPNLVARAIQQADSSMHKAAGMLSPMVPKLSRAVFVQAGPGTVVQADGRSATLPGGADPVFEPRAWPGAKSLKFARAASVIRLGSAPKT